jgi:hypothetical protein
MKRRFEGLSSMSQPHTETPDGVYLVRVNHVRYARERQRPYYAVRFTIVEPSSLTGRAFASRLYCTARALWKFSWFLRDFCYDSELFGHEEIDDKALIGLSGVVKVSHTVVNGRSLLNLDAFAPAAAWAGIGPQPALNPINKDAARKAAS